MVTHDEGGGEKEKKMRVSVFVSNLRERKRESRLERWMDTYEVERWAHQEKKIRTYTTVFGIP